MAISVPSLRVRPMPEGTRFRIAVAVSLVAHLVLLLFISFSRGPSSNPKRPSEPIEVSFTAAPPQEPIRQMLPEPQVQPEVRPKPKPAPPPPPPKRVVKMEARPVPRLSKSHLGGGGNPKARVVKNPSPITSRKSSSQPASNAGGKEKAAPAPPNLLTSKNGKTPAGPVGKGSAPFGPGGKAEVPGEGPTYGPGAVGGPDPIYPKAALDQGLEGTVTLSVTVGPDGKVTAVTVAQSSGHASLDAAAVRAVQRGWTFKAGMTKGKAAEGKVSVIFVFRNGDAKRG